MILLGTDIKHATLPSSGVSATVVKTLVVPQLVKTAILPATEVVAAMWEHGKHAAISVEPASRFAKATTLDAVYEKGRRSRRRLLLEGG